jgi:hypothetical protein
MMYIQNSITILTGQFPWVEQVSRSCTNIWLLGKLFVTTCPSFQLLLSKVFINYQVSTDIINKCFSQLPILEDFLAEFPTSFRNIPPPPTS